MIKFRYFLLAAIFFMTSVKASQLTLKKVKIYMMKKYDLAKFKFEQDIVFNPKNENSYLYLAKIYKFKKQAKLEEKNLNTVILLNPKNEQAIYNLALLKIKKSNYDETKRLIKDFKKFVKNFVKKHLIYKKNLIQF